MIERRHFLGLLDLAAARIAELGDVAGAHDLVARTAEMAPDDFELQHFCGVLHRRHGDAAQAFARFARTLELSPNFAYCEFEIGHTCTMLRQPEEALRWYRRAIASAPAFVPAYLSAARVARGLGQTSEALELLDQALAIEPEREDVRGERAGLVAVLDAPPPAEPRAPPAQDFSE